MRVAARGNVPQPKGLQAVFVEDVEQVFPVGRDSGGEDVAVVGEIFNRHLFDRQDSFAWQERVHPERSSDE